MLIILILITKIDNLLKKIINKDIISSSKQNWKIISCRINILIGYKN